MSEKEQLIWALEEHKRRHPETEEETMVALGRVLYPKEERQRGSHALREEERQKREAEREEMAAARAIIKQAQEEPAVREFRTTQDTYKSREQVANEKIKGATGILANIRERRKIGFSDIFAEKEGKK